MIGRLHFPRASPGLTIDIVCPRFCLPSTFSHCLRQPGGHLLGNEFLFVVSDAVLGVLVPFPFDVEF